MARMTPPPTKLWASGSFTLDVAGPRGPRRRVVVDRPYAVLGRARASDVLLSAPAVSGRHVYFHLDHRGVFAVDLATRSGARVGPDCAPSAWLVGGDSLEVAGFRVELVQWRVDRAEPPPELEPQSPLHDAGSAPLVRLTLFPESPPGDPLTLDSRLVFAGRSRSCGVPVADTSSARVQCVLVRGRNSGFVVDLVGRGTSRNASQVRGAEPLYDGDSLAIGSARFRCRVAAPGGGPGPNLPALALGVGSAASPPLALHAETFLETASPPPLHLVPADAQAAVFGWMIGQIQARQEESLRRQGQFQSELTQLVSEIHRDNQAMLARHLERSEEIHREVAGLRDEVARGFGKAIAATPSIPGPITPPTPTFRPLPPLEKIPIAPPSTDPEAAANWLLARADQLDRENRKGWKALLERLSGRKTP